MMRLVIVGIVAMLMVTLVGVGGAAAPDILPVAEHHRENGCAHQHDHEA